MNVCKQHCSLNSKTEKWGTTHISINNIFNNYIIVYSCYHVLNSSETELTADTGIYMCGS